MNYSKQHDHRAVEAPRVSIEEAGQLALQGQALVVDVRTSEEYRFSHAPGAISLPLRELSERLGMLPREQLLITICT